MIGYTGYILWQLETRTFINSRHVRCNEKKVYQEVFKQTAQSLENFDENQKNKNEFLNRDENKDTPNQFDDARMEKLEIQLEKQKRN